jgi:hypothetical protein
MPALTWGDAPTGASPLLSWPTFSVVGGDGERSRSKGAYYDVESLRREDDEIILILSAVIKEL